MAMPAEMPPPVIGTAGWSIAAAHRDAFPAGGSALERYAGRFGGAEVNSSFYRRHRASTWTRWAQSVPADFRFAVKLPKEISHERKLEACGAMIDAFLDEIAGLGTKLAILLLQLPPKFAFDERVVQHFFDDLLPRTEARIVCEPRHPSWFDRRAEALLDALTVARVAADPAVVPAAADPGGWRGLTYLRLHGSPQMYRSAYDAERLRGYAGLLAQERAAGRSAWCIFDNTAASAATGDALALMGMC